MLKRTITGLSMAAVMIYALLTSLTTALLLLSVILIFSAVEWNRHFNFSAPKLKGPYFFITIILLCAVLGIIVYSNPFFPIHPIYGILSHVASAIILYVCYQIFIKNKSPLSFCNSIFGYAYLLLPIVIAALFLVDQFELHRWWIFALIFMNWGNDTMAYLIGRPLGKTPLAPKISPKKTVEGTIGGVFGCLLGAWIMNTYFVANPLPLSLLFLLAVMISIVGSLGDLFESALKRSIDIKDSGSILPGHGGFLDRFDSFYFIIPVGVLLLYIFETYYL